MNNKKQIIVMVDSRLRDTVKNLADELDTDMKTVIRQSLIDFLKKHNKEIPVSEL
jgi:predicted transcriptional regulator